MKKVVVLLSLLLVTGCFDGSDDNTDVVKNKLELDKKYVCTGGSAGLVYTMDYTFGPNSVVDIEVNTSVTEATYTYEEDIITTLNPVTMVEMTGSFSEGIITFTSDDQTVTCE